MPKPAAHALTFVAGLLSALAISVAVAESKSPPDCTPAHAQGYERGFDDGVLEGQCRAKGMRYSSFTGACDVVVP
jgi:hypothetical protein